MDDERKLKEGYRTRLMVDHEVLDWAYTKPDNPKDMRGKGFDYEAANLSGKRHRKQVVYADEGANRNSVEDEGVEVKKSVGDDGSGSGLKRLRSPKSENVGDLPTWRACKKRSIIR